MWSIDAKNLSLFYAPETFQRALKWTSREEEKWENPFSLPEMGWIVIGEGNEGNISSQKVSSFSLWKFNCIVETSTVAVERRKWAKEKSKSWMEKMKNFRQQLFFPSHSLLISFGRLRSFHVIFHSSWVPWGILIDDKTSLSTAEHYVGSLSMSLYENLITIVPVSRFTKWIIKFRVWPLVANGIMRKVKPAKCQ